MKTKDLLTNVDIKIVQLLCHVLLKGRACSQVYCVVMVISISLAMNCMGQLNKLLIQDLIQIKQVILGVQLLLK